ncbi:hypothetical protein M1D55_10985 [Cupriavidus sp. JZ107]
MSKYYNIAVARGKHAKLRYFKKRDIASLVPSSTEQVLPLDDQAAEVASAKQTQEVDNGIEMPPLK